MSAGRTAAQRADVANDQGDEGPLWNSIQILAIAHLINMRYMATPAVADKMRPQSIELAELTELQTAKEP